MKLSHKHFSAINDSYGQLVGHNKKNEEMSTGQRSWAGNRILKWKIFTQFINTAMKC